MTTQFKVCNCNRSMPLDNTVGVELGNVLGAGPLPVSTELCRGRIDPYLRASGGSDPVVISCTQESAHFSKLAQDENASAPIRFVNIREHAGWTKQSKESLPKIAALLADAALPEPDPVPAVRYTSQGNVLIIGAAASALPWANRLCTQLNVSVLLTAGTGEEELPQERRFVVFSGSDVRVQGWLGAFDVSWQQNNPIDLDVCVRCNACIDACPESAINFLYQVDSEKCRRHGDCVKACGAIGAIDFERRETVRSAQFDLILDLSPQPLIALHQPPQGYFAPGADPTTQFDTALRITQMVGEFEKPKFFAYKEKLCAHARNKKVGCNACVEVCSAQAISGNGDRIAVNPHLCVGCGACTTVCPTGALGYAYPNAPHMGRRLKTLLTTYASAGGAQPVILLHGPGEGAEIIKETGRLAKVSKTVQGLPANVIPVELHHVASTGIDVWLTAVAYGAAGVAVLSTGEEAPQYIASLKEQMAIAQIILNAWGYGGTHLHMIEASSAVAFDAMLQHLPPGETAMQPATFIPSAEKRNTLDFALEHLYRNAPDKQEEVLLPAGAPFGAIQVNTDACTLCMACTGACPASALIDRPDLPQLRFIEKNCVQCGLCAETCPEDAITLVPRLAMMEAVKKPVVMNEAEPFTCIRCHKPFGTLKVVESMIAKLANHGAFAGNLDRIKMCGDCRVVDMMEGRNAASITSVSRPR